MFAGEEANAVKRENTGLVIFINEQLREPFVEALCALLLHHRRVVRASSCRQLSRG
jgi:hypothetical protein